jgi:hypothetical protein
MTIKKRTILRLECYFLFTLLFLVGCAKGSESYEPSAGGSFERKKVDPSAISSRDGAISASDTGTQTVADASRTPYIEISVPDGSCGAVTTEAKTIEVERLVEREVPVTKPKPFAIYIMLDQSSSMREGNPETKWKTAVSAINAFASDPNSVGIQVSLQTFPADADSCDGTAYRTPALSNIPLPDTTGAIAAHLAYEPESIGTPMEGALRGLGAYCSAFQADKPNNPNGMKCVNVLITDGEPSTCDRDKDNLAAIGGNTFTSHGVTTYAVGMQGADFKFLGDLAQKSGAKDCDLPTAATPAFNACNVGASTDTKVPTLTLLQALELVREYSTEIETVVDKVMVPEIVKLDCEWGIPELPKGQFFDKAKVNVAFSSTGVEQDNVFFGYAKSQQECGDSSEAWFYDNNDAPTRVIACPKTCDAIKKADKGKIGIVFGCEIIPIK